MQSDKTTSFQSTDHSVTEYQSENKIPANGLLNSLKRNIAKWHRTVGLITIVPVIFWSISGLMHPFLSHWFKPEIARQLWNTTVLDQQQIQISIQELLNKNQINEFKSFRFVEWNGKTYYQVKLIDDEIRYYDAIHGHALKNADKQYAEFLARYFIDDQKSIIKSITLQTEFDQQYNYVNRLLPVWKVSFDRADQIDLYIETTSNRLGTFNTKSRKVFLWVFDNFHKWSFLQNVTNNAVKISIMVIMLSVILLSAISGLLFYGLFWRFGKSTSAVQRKGLRKYHRQIGMATAFITLTFAFSGAFHATRKLEPNRLPEMIFDPIIRRGDLQMSSLSLNIDQERFQNLSVVKKGKAYFFQVFYTDSEDKSAETIYVNAKDGTIWKDGDKEYAQFLGKKFLTALSNKNGMARACCEEMGERGNFVNESQATLLKTEQVLHFESREYGFVFKRLPVTRLVYDTPDNNTLYVETATSRLAAAINNTDRIEGYSFAIFHKYLLMDWAGKNVRDITMMLSAFGLLTVSILGLLIFLKKS